MIRTARASARTKALAIGLAFLAGCSGAAQRGVYWASLYFDPETETVRGFPGRVFSVDGERVAAMQRQFRVAPGRRRIAYQCPNTLSVDGPPVVVAEFAAGKTYDLVCTGAQATVRARP